MEFSKIKKGDYFRWKAKRYMREWNVYGKVLKLGIDSEEYDDPRGYIEVMTFDDCKTVKLYHRPNDSDGAIEHEMTKVDKENVEEWLEEYLERCEDRKREIKRQYRKAKRDINKKINKIKEIVI